MQIDVVSGNKRIVGPRAAAAAIDKLEAIFDEPHLALTPDQEMTIFRIVQDALRNLQGHIAVEANAANALARDETWLRLTIVDFGRGHDPQTAVPRPGTSALQSSMRERAKLAGDGLTDTNAPAQVRHSIADVTPRPHGLARHRDVAVN